MEAIEYYTYDDYRHWEGKWELYEGFPVSMSPAPTIQHQAIASLIIGELVQSVKECNSCLVLNEEDWKVDEVTVLKPDVVLVCDEPGDAYITKAPEIIVEVISPSSARRDEKIKFGIYESEKVPYYILVYPNDLKAKIYRLENGNYSKEGDFFSETYHFSELTCDVTINFDTIFKRFRK